MFDNTTPLILQAFWLKFSPPYSTKFSPLYSTKYLFYRWTSAVCLYCLWWFLIAISPELKNCVHVVWILDVVNGDVNLVEETPNPSEDKQIAEVKESKKKVGRPKKVIAKLPLTQIKKVDKGKKVSPPTGKSPPKARPSPKYVRKELRLFLRSFCEL